MPTEKTKEMIFMLSAIFFLSLVATAVILLLLHVFNWSAVEDLKTVGEIIIPVFIIFGLLILYLCMRLKKRI